MPPPRVQNYQSSEESAINHLFGTGLHTSLTCAETGEKIEARPRCPTPALPTGLGGPGARLRLLRPRTATAASQ